MRIFLSIFLLLILGSVYGQLPDVDIIGYPDAKVTDQYRANAAATVPTSGVFTANPVVKDGYFCVDIYVVRFTEWESNSYDKIDDDIAFYYYNAIGSLSVAIKQSPANGSSDYYGKKFSASDFYLEPVFTDLDATHICPLEFTLNEFLPGKTTTTYQFVYSVNSEHSNTAGIQKKKQAKKIVLELNVPFKMGTLKMKISDPTKTSGMILTGQGNFAGVFAKDEAEAALTTNYMIVGWLDKDPNISLTPEAEVSRPADPEFALAPASLCANTSGTYTLTKMPDRAVACEWTVSETQGGAPISDNNICVITPNPETTAATIQWNAGAAGKQYWVNVYARNDATPVECSATVSTRVTVNASPNVLLAVTKGGTALNKDAISECPGVTLAFSVANTPGVNYVWSGGATGSGYTKTATLANTGTSDIIQKYKVVGTANGCSAADSAIVTTKTAPGGLAFDPAASSFPSGQMLNGFTVIGTTGAAINSWNWTSPVKSTAQAIDFVVQSGKTAVTVEVGSASGCKTTLTHDITSSGGLTLALTPVGGDGKICIGGVVRLKAEVSGAEAAGTRYNYQWYKGSTATGTPIRGVSNMTEAVDYLTVTDAGDYTVKVTTNGNLTASQTKTVAASGTTIKGVTVLPVIIAATPSKQVVLLAETEEMKSKTWEWTPVNMLASGEAGKQNPLTAVITKETTYEVFMTSGSCVSSGKTVVKLPENTLALTVKPGAASLCLGNRQQLKATLTGGSGAVSYAWSPAAMLSSVTVANPVFTAVTAGVYPYVVTARKGAEVVTSRVVLTVSPMQAPVLTLPNQIYCSGSELVAVNSVNAAPKFNWKITNESNVTTTNTTTAPRIKLDGVGKYTVKVVGEITGVCISDTASINIELRKPELSQTLSATTYPAGGTISSTAVASAGWEPYTYAWNMPSNPGTAVKDVYTITGASLPAYVFNVSMVDAKGCAAAALSQTANMTGGGLTLALDMMYAYCNGGMAMLKAEASGGTGPYKYVWKKVGAATGVDGTTDGLYLVESPAAGDVYEVTVTDASAPALTRKETINLDNKKEPLLDAPNLTTPGTITIQRYQPAILSTNAGAAVISQWNWSPEDKLITGEAVKPYAKTKQLADNQLFQVYVVDNKGCISQKAPLNVKVVEDNTNFEVAINASTLMCIGGKQTLSVKTTPEQAGATYTWSSAPDIFTNADMTDPARPVIIAPASGKYTVAVTVKNTSGIQNTAIQDIDVKNAELPNLTLTFNPQVCEGDTVRVSSHIPIKGDVYTWYVNGTKQPGTDAQLAIAGSGSNQVIKVVATATNECTGEKEETKQVNARPTLVWNPVPKSPIEVGEVLTATVLPGPKAISDYTYTWTSSKVGVTPNDNTYTVTAGSGDTKITLTSVATDGATTCKSLPVSADVTVSKPALTPVIAVIGKVCIGGSAVLEVVDVEGDEGPYTYVWTKVGDASETPLGTDKRLVISPVSTTDPVSYKVVVTKEGTSKKGEATQQIQAVPSLAVPQIQACEDVTIGVNEQATLTATQTGATASYVWNWMPENKITAGEVHAESPKTIALDADTKFGVYLINGGAEKCVSPVDYVNVIINGRKALAVEIQPSTDAFCIGNKVKFTANVTGGTGNIESYQWVNNGEVKSTSATYEYTATAAMTDTITLVVTEGGVTGTARKVITIKPFTAPVLEFVNENAVKCAGNTLEVRTKNSEAITGNYSWVVTKENSLSQSASSDRYLFATAGKYNVKVTAKNDQCALDTIHTDITIAPIPVITEIRIVETCGEAKVAAITEYTDSWEWASGAVFQGTVRDGVDSIYYFKTTEMSKAFSGTLIAKNAAGCASAEQSFNGTTYSLPEITLNPETKEVYPGTKVDITATLVPALGYTLNWKEVTWIESGATTNTIKTKALTASDDPYTFTIEVQNPLSPACKNSKVTVITVDSEDFRVAFQKDKDTVDVCQNVATQFVVDAVNNKFPPVTYLFGSDALGFISKAASQVNTTTQAFTTPGVYKLWVEAKNNNTIPDVRVDTVVVRVNPTPTLDVTSPELSAAYSLCDKRGKVEVDMDVTGTANWTFYYRLGGVKKTEAITAPAHKMVLTEGGEFYMDSIVDSKGCKATYTDLGFAITDDVPRIALTSTDPITKCQGSQTDLGIVPSNTISTDYALMLYYKEGVVKKEFSFTDATTKFATTYKGGTITLDSIKSARGCVYKLTANNKVTVNEYPESNPQLVLGNTDPQFFCDGGSLDIPVSITGGKAGYTINYTLAGADKSVTLPDDGDGIDGTEGTIGVDGNGPFVLKSFKDVNGCGIYTADQTIQITKNEKPTMAVTTTNRLLCGGALDLGLTFTGKAPFNVHYTVDGGISQIKTFKTDDGSLLADKTAVWNITNKGNILISKVTDANCEIEGTAVTGGPQIAVDSFRLYVKLDASEARCATAGAKLKFDFAGTTWGQVVGDIQLSYDYTPSGGTVTHKTITVTKAVAQEGKAAIASVEQGKYVLTGVTDLKGSSGPSCSGILPKSASDREVTVIQAPVVEIDSSDFAAVKGHSFVLGIKSDVDQFIFKYEWQKVPGNFTEAAPPKFTTSGVMADADLQYVLKASNRSETSCYSTDTVNVYRIPDAPIVTIDTNTTRNDIRISWEPATGADNYTLMANRWDAYAMETPYSKRADMSKTSLYYDINTSKLDTLEFFYLTADRTIKGKKYSSVASDTVGYYNVDIRTNTNGKNINIFTFFFDPVGMGIDMTKDVFEMFGKKIKFIRSYDYPNQGWKFARQLGTSVPGDFEIKQGMGLQFESASAFEFLQYGILPDKFAFTLKSKNNLCFFQPGRLDLKYAKDVLLELKPSLSFVRKWSFEDQGWSFARLLGTSCPGDFELKPILMPLMLEMKVESTDINWK